MRTPPPAKFKLLVIAMLVIAMVAALSDRPERTGGEEAGAAAPFEHADQPSEAESPLSPSLSGADLSMPDGSVIRAMGVPEFEALLALSQTRPVYMMVFASWCPHCKRMFGQLNGLQQEYGERLHVAAVSIDNSPQALLRFAGSIHPMRLDTYIIRDGDAYRSISERLRAFGLQFRGGQERGVAVPYNVVFFRGEPVAEMSGALPPDALEQFVRELVEGAQAQDTHTS